MNDCYWVVDEIFKGTFDSVNLYDNHFSRTLAYIAFTGYGSSIRSTFRSSPEFTTNGMLAGKGKTERYFYTNQVQRALLIREMNRMPNTMLIKSQRQWAWMRLSII